MRINYDEAVTFNTFRTISKGTISVELLKEMVESIIGLLLSNINFSLMPKRTALDIIESWLPCSCLLHLNEENDILTITNTIYGCKFKYAIDFEKNIFCYLPSAKDGSVNSDGFINDLKQEYDNYDASKENIETFAGEDIF